MKISWFKSKSYDNLGGGVEVNSGITPRQAQGIVYVVKIELEKTETAQTVDFE